MPLPIIAYVIVGTAVSAGATVAAWLSSDDWGVDEYKDNMSKTHATILAWHDQVKKTGCWNKLKPELRSQWQNYMTRFGEHWKKGVPSVYVSDDEERTARALISELPEWAKRFEACGVGETKDVPFLDRFSKDDLLKLGGLLIAGAFAYRLVKGKPLFQLGGVEPQCVKYEWKMVRGERKLVCVQWAWPKVGGLSGSGWNAKDERMYRHILISCLKRRGARECKRIAGATVNQQRRAEGRLLAQR